MPVWLSKRRCSGSFQATMAGEFCGAASIAASNTAESNAALVSSPGLAV